MEFPATKLLRVTKGTTFDYTFQYVIGNPGDSVPFNLTGYTGAWVITPNVGSQFTLTTGNTGGESGVFFGGDPDPADGIIDLVIDSADTTTIDWQWAEYTFSIASGDEIPVVTELLTGGISATEAI